MTLPLNTSVSVTEFCSETGNRYWGNLDQGARSSVEIHIGYLLPSPPEALWLSYNFSQPYENKWETGNVEWQDRKGMWHGKHKWDWKMVLSQQTQSKGPKRLTDDTDTCYRYGRVRSPFCLRQRLQPYRRQNSRSCILCVCALCHFELQGFLSQIAIILKLRTPNPALFFLKRFKEEVPAMKRVDPERKCFIWTTFNWG
jgi:hypothetical protein